MYLTRMKMGLPPCSNLETDADTPHFDREASSVAQSPQRTFSSAQEDNLRSEFKSVLERTAVEKASEQGDNEDSFIIEAQDSASEGSDLIDNLTDRWHTTSTISDERPHLDTDDIPEKKLENSQTEKAYTATAEGDGFSKYADEQGFFLVCGVGDRRQIGDRAEHVWRLADHAGGFIIDMIGKL